MIKDKLSILFLFFCFYNLWSQKPTDNIKISDFELYFTPLKSPLLIDDITVKYSKNNVLEYSIIKKYIKDSSGRLLIIIDNEKYHQFKAIASKKMNDSISYYIFSHRSNINKIKFNYVAYLVVFNKSKLVDFRSVYSNSVEGTDKHYGSVIINDKFAFFQSQKSDYEYYKIDDNGFVYEDDKNIDIFDLNFRREKNYKIEFNSKFYKEEKVLLPIIEINNKKPSQVLRTIAKNNLKLQQTFFIDAYKKNEFTEFIYLNLLQPENGLSFKNTYEVIKDLYGVDGKWLKNVSLSDFFIMPNKKEIIEVYYLQTK